jgi:hypothetical protein
MGKATKYIITSTGNTYYDTNSLYSVAELIGFSSKSFGNEILPIVIYIENGTIRYCELDEEGIECFNTEEKANERVKGLAKQRKENIEKIKQSK